jgi:predicted transcriptional regulator
MIHMTAELCRAARGWLDWSQIELANQAKVHKRTVADFERGHRQPLPRTLRDIFETFERAGVVFLQADGVIYCGLRMPEAAALTD